MRVIEKDLLDAWRGIVKHAKLVRHHASSREELSMLEHVRVVWRELKVQKFVAFEDLFDNLLSMPVLVVTLVAVLEWSKEELLWVTASWLRTDLIALALHANLTPDQVVFDPPSLWQTTSAR